MAKPSLREKDILNPEETICYWNFSIRKLYRFLEQTDGGISWHFIKRECWSSVLLLNNIYLEIQK